jgi:hypothetical protein
MYAMRWPLVYAMCFVLVVAQAAQEPTEFEPTKPMLRRKLQNTAARCLDGSPPAYYLRRGSVDKWAVFFEGGGWCYDLQQCHQRSKGDLGSSLKYPPILDTSRIGHFKEYLSPSPQENRLMHNWNTGTHRIEYYTVYYIVTYIVCI